MQKNAESELTNVEDGDEIIRGTGASYHTVNDLNLFDKCNLETDMDITLANGTLVFTTAKRIVNMNNNEEPIILKNVYHILSSRLNFISWSRLDGKSNTTCTAKDLCTLY